ncbi:MAG: hypothetical protein ABEJ98_05805 [Candidatus Nanohaloarchaea archaeon]
MRGPEVEEILDGEVEGAEVKELESPVSDDFSVRRADLPSQGSTLKAVGVYRGREFQGGVLVPDYDPADVLQLRGFDSFEEFRDTYSLVLGQRGKAPFLNEFDPAGSYTETAEQYRHD